MPENNILSFYNHQKKMKVPFVAYADFESSTSPVYGCNPDSKSSYTTQYQKHEPSGFCLYVKCFHDSVGFNMEPIVYSKQKY